MLFSVLSYILISPKKGIFKKYVLLQALRTAAVLGAALAQGRQRGLVGSPAAQARWDGQTPHGLLTRLLLVARTGPGGNPETPIWRPGSGPGPGPGRGEAVTATFPPVTSGALTAAPEPQCAASP